MSLSLSPSLPLSLPPSLPPSFSPPHYLPPLPLLVMLLFGNQPALATNPRADVQRFITEFEQEYGNSHPRFLTCSYGDVCLYLCIYVRMYVCMYVCMYVSGFDQ